MHIFKNRFLGLNLILIFFFIKSLKKLLFLKLETFLYMSKIEYICGFKTTEISELIMSFLNTKTGKKYRVVELDKGIYCLSDILGGRKT